MVLTTRPYSGSSACRLWSTQSVQRSPVASMVTAALSSSAAVKSIQVAHDSPGPVDLEAAGGGAARDAGGLPHPYARIDQAREQALERRRVVLADRSRRLGATADRAILQTEFDRPAGACREAGAAGERPRVAHDRPQQQAARRGRRQYAQRTARDGGNAVRHQVVAGADAGAARDLAGL